MFLRLFQSLCPGDRVIWRMRLIPALCLVGLVSGCASQKIDPFEGVNRGFQSFNDTTDRFLLKPIAIGYSAVLPNPVERGVANVFSNAADPWVAINQLLQGKPGLSVRDTGRFLLNSTLGVGGLFDVAGRMGLEKHDEDFGQTLAVWGVGQGPYLVVPFWGPSNPRDGIGDIVGSFAYVPRYIDHVPTRNIALALDVISQRADLLDAERLISGDRYLFIRDAYLQRRDYLINDAVVEDSFLDDEF